ncbi:MAG: hypothetical protein HYS13_08335 [Planctomycetia bacterium]|nr:hypothetical protein [Planctomycetia bacterium]
MVNKGDFFEIPFEENEATVVGSSDGQPAADEVVMDSPPFSEIAHILKGCKPLPRPNRCAPLDRLNPPPPDDNK